MRDFIIAVNRYFHKYKYIIAILVLAIVFITWVSNLAAKSLRENNYNNNNSSVLENTTIVVDNNLNKTDEQRISEVQTPVSAIQTFVDFCNAKKIDSAYSMIADDCREALFTTKNDFIKKYYNKYFTESRNVSIIQYRENTYKVSYLVNSLITGTEQKEKLMEDYISITEDNKLRLLSYTGKESMDKTVSDLFLKAKVIERYWYIDHEDYKIEFTNQTSASITLDNSNLTTEIKLVDSQNNYYNLDTSNLYAGDYVLAPGQTKTLLLQFLRTDTTSGYSNKIVLNNVRIENYEYGDIGSATDNGDGTISYERRNTKYPEKITFQIEI